jgi:hypothetical protein
MTKSTPPFLRETLDSRRQEIFPLLAPFKEMGFYLAGGTGLALEIGHRKSDDFDFFRVEPFDSEELFETVSNIFAPRVVTKTFASQNTLYCETLGVKLSFFSYRYPLIETSYEYPNVKIAHKKDIAAMKFFALQKRATKKDYADLFFLLKEFSLGELFETFFQKYGRVVSEMLLRKSLAYSEDLPPDEVVIFTDPRADFKKMVMELRKKAEAL